MCKLSSKDKSDDGIDNALTSKKSNKDPSTLQYFIGMMMASMFTLAYVIGPISLPMAILFLFFYPTNVTTWLFCAPVLISMIFPPRQMPWLLNKMTPVLDYFQYDEVMEMSNEEWYDLTVNKNKSIIFAAVPHGVVSCLEKATFITIKINNFLSLVFIWGSL